MLVRKRSDKSKLVYKLMLDTIQQQHERRYDICKQIIKVLGLKFKLELKGKKTNNWRFRNFRARNSTQSLGKLQ